MTLCEFWAFQFCQQDFLKYIWPRGQHIWHECQSNIWSKLQYLCRENLIYLHCVQSRWGLRTSSMLWAGYHSHFSVGVGKQLSERMGRPLFSYRFPGVRRRTTTQSISVGKNQLRGVIDKFVSFFHRIIIYVWIYIIFYHYQKQSAVSRKKTLKCKVQQTCDVSMTFMTSHVGDVVVKTLEDRCGWCTLSGYKCYSISAIILKF